VNENSSPSEQPDPVLDRLRAADPAAGAEPDLAVLDAAVRARRADPTDELATARARRGRWTWWPVAAVAASALVFGTAGFALGNSDGGARGGAANTAGGVITLGQQDTGGRAGSEAAPATAGSKLSSSMIAPWFGGRTVFDAAGLPDDAGSAEAWAFDPAKVFTQETANRLARALSLPGVAALVNGAWTVGPTDGSGPSLQLQPDGVASVNYSNPALEPYGCQQVAPESVPPGSATGSGSTGAGGLAPSAGVSAPTAANPSPQPPQPCASTSIGTAPQGDAAIARARDLLGSLGLDPKAFEYEAQDSGMPQSSWVTASQVVGGQRTGGTWSVGLVGDGVQSLSGSLAPVRSLGTYDVVSARAAAARLTDPRFGAGSGWPNAYAAQKGSVTAGTPSVVGQGVTSSPDLAPAPQRTVPPTTEPGSAIAWPVIEVKLTTSRRGLTMYTQPDGATVLLPAYELSSGDGRVWSVLAVTDSHLDFAPVG